jgi:hypothetical protein
LWRAVIVITANIIRVAVTRQPRDKPEGGGVQEGVGAVVCSKGSPPKYLTIAELLARRARLSPIEFAEKRLSLPLDEAEVEPKVSQPNAPVSTSDRATSSKIEERRRGGGG